MDMETYLLITQEMQFYFYFIFLLNKNATTTYRILCLLLGRLLNMKHEKETTFFKC